MTTRILGLDERLHDYLLAVSVREPPVLAELREETAKLPRAEMMIAREQGPFLGFLIELIGARRALEIGVFTGYSSIWIALALPADGELVACELSEDYAAVARRYWHRAGVDARVRLELGPAVATLDRLVATGHAGTFDLAFVDADKDNYVAYYERSVELVRPGGLVVVDNVLWSGRVADVNNQEASTEAIRTLNTRIGSDPRVSASLVPIGDGMFLARKH